MPKLIITNEVFELEEAATELGIGIATLFRWLKAGKVVPLRLDHRTYILKAEIERVKQAK